MRRKLARTFGAIRRLVAHADRFLFDPTPAGERIWGVLFVAIVTVMVGDVIFAALRGRGLL